MKMRNKLLYVIFLGIFLSSNAFCASIGDVETNGKGKFSIGVDEEFVFQREMQGKDWMFRDVVNGLALTAPVHVQPEIKKMDRFLVKGSYGICDFLDAFIKIGEASFTTKCVVNGPATWLGGGPTWTTSEGTYKAYPAPVYAGGLLFAVPIFNNFLFGCNAQYLAHFNSYEAELTGEYSGGGQSGSYRRQWNNEMLIQEWHVAPYVALKIKDPVPHLSLIPYVGMRYSDFAEFSTDYLGGRENYYADTNIGLFTGINIKVCDRLVLKCEGRFFDETALSFGGAIKF